MLSLDKFFRSALFPIVIIAALGWLAYRTLSSDSPKTVSWTWSKFVHAIRTDAGGVSSAGVTEDRNHQSLSATINGRKVTVNYPAQSSLPRLEHLLAAQGIPYKSRATNGWWWDAAWALLVLPPIVFWMQLKSARRRKHPESV